MTKCVIEYGIRGGYHKDNIVLPSCKLGAELASSMVNMLDARETQFKGNWVLSRCTPRQSWSNGTHFVSLSILDGVMRGPASATLWKP
jgi:hypothetical protein